MNQHSPIAQQDLAQIYAAFAASVTFDTLPQSTVQAVAVNLFDTLSCTLAGYLAEGSGEVRDLVVDWGGKPEATIFGTTHKVPAPQAAWINGIMSHARDYDDTHDTAIIHVGVSAIPAALAAAEIAGRAVSGKEFYTAIALGMELSTRMAVATTIGVIDSGFIYSSLFGYFGATVAAAHIAGLDEADILNAMGISYSQAAGGHQVTRDGAWTKRMQPGFAARAALTSLAMTKKGVKGPYQIFQGEDGLWKIYLRNALNAHDFSDALGKKWHIEDLSYKPYPCCRYNHTAIDAAKIIHAQEGFDWRDIVEIRTYTTEQCRSAVGTPVEVRRAPRTLPQAQFSIPYNVACALVNGEVSLADFSSENSLQRPEIKGLAAKTTMFVDPEIERDWGRNVSPTRIEVDCGAKTFTARVDLPKGSPQNPFTAADTRRKLEDSLRCGGFSTSATDAFETILGSLLQSKDIVADFRKLYAVLSDQKL